MKKIISNYFFLIVLLSLFFSACEKDQFSNKEEITQQGKKHLLLPDIDIIDIDMPSSAKIGDVITISGHFINNGNGRYNGPVINLGYEVSSVLAGTLESRNATFNKLSVMPPISILDVGKTQSFSQELYISPNEFQRGQQHIIIIWPTTTINPYDEETHEFIISIK